MFLQLYKQAFYLLNKGRCRRFSFPAKFWSWSLQALSYQFVKVVHQIWYSRLCRVKLKDLANLGIYCIKMKRKIACLLYNTVSFSSNYASVMKDAIVRKWIVSSTSLCHWLRTVSFLETALLLLLVQKYALNLARNSNVLNYWQCMHLHHYILPYEIPILFIN